MTGRIAQLVMLFLFSTGLVLGQTQPSASGQTDAKNILFLYSYGYGSKGIEVFSDSFRETMVGAGVSVSNIFSEYLDLERNKEDPQYRQRLKELLERKYSERRIDLVITVQQPALNFLLTDGKEIAPAAAAITTAAPVPTIAEVGERRIVSHSAGFDMKGTLELAMKLFPATQRVVFASGSSDADKKLALAAAESAAKWQDKLKVEFTFDLSLDDMLKRVSSLPPATIIVFTQYNRDVQGRVGVAYEVESMLIKSANAPVFGFYDFNLYGGGIGGSVLGVGKLGETTAQLALDLLRGERQLSEQITSVKSEPFPMFNWDQIKRWGADPALLPSHTVFVNRVPTFWEQYKTYVIGLMIFVLVQSLLIFALMMNKRRRAQAEILLRESNEHLAITLYSISDAVLATDLSGRITRMNPTAERLCGWSLADALGQPLTEVFRIVNATTREAMADPVHLVMLHGQAVGLNNHTLLLARDGHEYQIADSAAPIRNASNEIVGVVLVFSDVTEKYQSELALRKSEERWKFAIESAGDGLWDWNTQTGKVFYSSRYKAMLGFAEDEFGDTAGEWIKRIHPDDAPGVFAVMQPYLEGKPGSITVEFRMLCKNGRWQWILGRGMVVSR
ncbi:MAG: signal transduction histidine kinase NtrB [Comamonadaceae bacterium]|nr:MAG: signal transduction histidine kinase NtrB [Comamonadaceae bacterium]